jgi:glycerol-3-phosphate dehydrogenase
VVLSAERLPLDQAISMFHPRDGRAVFALPWEGITLVGTTDVDHHGSMQEEPSISSGELEYILESIRHAFPRMDIGEKDVRSTFSGVRSVINTGASDPSKESREHALWQENGLITVTGGKLTTFRLMAIETLRAAKKQLPAVDGLRRARILDDVGTEGLPASIPAAVTERMLGRHGREAKQILSGPEGAETIADTNVLWGELRFAARDEAVVHLTDLLLRRARLGLLAVEGGMKEMARIRAVAQPELGWDDATWEREEADYRRTWRERYGSSPAKT